MSRHVPATTTPTAASSSSSSYQVVHEATVENPWALGVIGALPTTLVEETALFRSGVRDGPWSAWLVQPEAQSNKNKNEWHVHVCYTNAAQSMTQQKFDTPVTELVVESDAPPLLALQHVTTSSSSSTPTTPGGLALGGPTAFLYVLQRTTGDVRGYKISATATTPLGRPLQAVLPLDKAEEMACLVATTMTDNHHKPVLYAATQRGRLFRLVPRPATHSLTWHDITARPSSASSSLLRYLVGSSGVLSSSSTWNFPAVQAIVPAVQPALSSSSAAAPAFWTVSNVNAVQLWYATPAASSTTTAAATTSTTTPSSSSALKWNFDDSAPLHSSAVPAQFQVCRVVQATAHSVHVLGRMTSASGRGMSPGWYAIRWKKQQSDDWYVAAVTWLNRLSETAVCLGWQASQNGIAWGAFAPQGQQDPHAVVQQPTILLAIVAATTPSGNDEDTPTPTTDEVYEYDCDPEDPLLPNSFQADYATHGVTFGYQSGVWMRAQVKVATAASRGTSTTGSSWKSRGMDQRRLEVTLLSHLRSTFQAYYRTSSTSSAALVELPPSWNTPDVGLVRDQVVAKLGLENLPQAGNDGARSSGHLSSLHRSYVDFLQQIGLYRSLQHITKWQLFAMGQEIDAYENLPLDLIHERYWPQNAALAPWMELYQSKVVWDSAPTGAVTLDQMNAWTKILAASLGAAMRFKLEQESFPYDLGTLPIVKQREQVPLWLARPTLLKTLRGFVDFWTRADLELVIDKEMETVLLAALESAGAAFASLQGERQVRRDYAHMQKFVIQLLCRGGMRDLAWALSQEHKYFAGLCELARKHEKVPDTPFSLQPLFEKMKIAKDVETGLTFGAFVMNWHVERKLYGHALEYGEFCPNDLKLLAEHDTEFGQYKWIVAVRERNFEDATKVLIRNTSPGRSTVGQTKVNMGFAKIANSLAAEKDRDAHAMTPAGASQREKSVDRLRERANAQELLFGETEEARATILKPADELLRYACNVLGRQESIRAKVVTCLQALGVCATFDTTEDARKGAARVWSEALQTDLGMLKQFVLNAPKIDLEYILNKTVLGALYTEAAHAPEWTEIMLNDDIGSRVLEGLSPEDRPGVSRMFHCLSVGQ